VDIVLEDFTTNVSPAAAQKEVHNKACHVKKKRKTGEGKQVPTRGRANAAKPQGRPVEAELAEATATLVDTKADSAGGTSMEVAQGRCACADAVLGRAAAAPQPLQGRQTARKSLGTTRKAQENGRVTRAGKATQEDAQPSSAAAPAESGKAGKGSKVGRPPKALPASKKMAQKMAGGTRKPQETGKAAAAKAAKGDAECELFSEVLAPDKLAAAKAALPELVPNMEIRHKPGTELNVSLHPSGSFF
jgi:hypothetical protein